MGTKFVRQRVRGIFSHSIGRSLICLCFLNIVFVYFLAFWLNFKQNVTLSLYFPTFHSFNYSNVNGEGKLIELKLIQIVLR